MANLAEIANLAWEQQFPLATDEVAISRESFIATARSEYAYQFLLWYWKEKRDEGVFNLPGNLYTESDPLPVVNNEIDISGLDILVRLPSDIWLAKVDKLTSSCNYIKSNVNQTQLLKEDDSLPDDYKTYLILGSKLVFPKGTHSDKLTIIYANNGSMVDENIEVDDAIAGLVRDKLNDTYLGKVAPTDKTNNTNSNG